MGFPFAAPGLPSRNDGITKQYVLKWSLFLHSGHSTAISRSDVDLPARICDELDPLTGVSSDVGSGSIFARDGIRTKHFFLLRTALQLK
jgi:hypothetical protein